MSAACEANRQTLKLKRRLVCIFVGFSDCHFAVSFCLCGYLLFGCWKSVGKERKLGIFRQVGVELG